MDWDAVDHLGKKLGSPFHPCRVVGAIEWCMYQDYEEGKNTCTSRDNLQTRMNRLIGSDEITFHRGLNLALRTGAVIEYQGVYQLPATYWYERQVEKFINSNNDTDLTMTQIDDWLRESRHKDLNPEQRKAVVSALSYRISAYYGKPGRGKTWSLRAIIDGAEKLLKKKRVILAAVTARAKAKMQSETGHPPKDCLTIARLIHIEKKTSLCNSLIAVDEASMLSLADAFRIFKKVPHDCHIVLVGDHHQNPSIEAGRVFYDIIANNAVPNVELIENNRHDKKTDHQLQILLDGQFPEFDEYKRGCGCGIYSKHVMGKTPREAQKLADEEAIALYREFLTGDEDGTVQIISPLRKKKYLGSSEAINFKVHREIWGEQAGMFPAETPVVWTHNKTVNSGENLSNGSVGIVHEVCEDNSEYSLFVAFENEGVVGLKKHEVSEYLEHAYCLSIHQAQGSEWDNVIIILPRSEIMIDRNIIYSALSRCRKRSIVIYCDHTFIQKKVAEPPAHERRMSLFLKRFE